VAFGGASSCSTGCGYAPVPQKRLRARLEKIHIYMYMSDEIPTNGASALSSPMQSSEPERSKCRPG
jgi:hypothetical protein